ncbi:hypothetical protein CTAYLR_007222 [Chrysophaeum taylorii]|uniref:Peroxiredoxin-like 2A n=1 Tax=Chrysophaeum taylorii TaxID=2483200 RepID=A0AAD7XH64_9STRA|nr:hypothetical protein CTAYLR_007222 [Chrysophaeum taylorii]
MRWRGLGTTAFAVSAVGFAVQRFQRGPPPRMISTLGDVVLRPVSSEGALEGAALKASSLWTSTGAVIFVAANDTVLGVGEFQRDYFKNDLFLDEERDFYAYLGNRKLITLRSALGALLRPDKFYRGLRAVNQRVEAKGIDGNMVGEGLTQGGVLVVAPDGQVRYTYLEKTGQEIPVDEINAALDDL